MDKPRDGLVDEANTFVSIDAQLASACQMEGSVGMVTPLANVLAYQCW